MYIQSPLRIGMLLEEAAWYVCMDNFEQKPQIAWNIQKGNTENHAQIISQIYYTMTRDCWLNCTKTQCKVCGGGSVWLAGLWSESH